ncbi:RNA-directed DNA methylation 4-like [Brassica napus]|uniref:RNA-directed DNA methylation 4-like n=1 Tax=Brassica oleracea var. oleracea TaxID=109376 RepID=UPI0006A7379D|nr:PREDICTED: RNA-directed DNA methylation 4-like [Brassica oleracea var. oleracea]XP_013704983.1 RNA-directed DNA methylation 4-like [Brassica napus]
MELLHLFCRIQVKVGGKPVIVRVKRKVGRDLKTLWQLGLEINERSFKLPLLNLSKLPLSGSVKKEDVKPKKVLLRHLETVTVDVIHSLFARQLAAKESLKSLKLLSRRKEQRLTKDCKKQQVANSRLVKSFTVSARPLHRMLGLSNWRSGKGNKDKELHERCSFYDVIRVDAEEKPE